MIGLQAHFVNDFQLQAGQIAAESFDVLINHFKVLIILQISLKEFKSQLDEE
jgi:hypothetical protein